MATSGDLARLLLSRATEDEAAARELLPVDPYAARARYEAPDPATVDRETALALASTALGWGRGIIDG